MGGQKHAKKRDAHTRAAGAGGESGRVGVKVRCVWGEGWWWWWWWWEWGVGRSALGELGAWGVDCAVGRALRLMCNAPRLMPHS